MKFLGGVKIKTAFFFCVKSWFHITNSSFFTLSSEYAAGAAGKDDSRYYINSSFVNNAIDYSFGCNDSRCGTVFSMLYIYAAHDGFRRGDAGCRAGQGLYIATGRRRRARLSLHVDAGRRSAGFEEASRAVRRRHGGLSRSD
ncbi:hypothetical protein [Burkholderia cenocepacia]|uniref:hypothetical protein n=1 Tax=Burkholderia cenocepacia TaxID=95486 RepID=UPI0022307BDC|nr:hypothetical protein [Burkholderia cenocepacia]